MMRFAVTSLCTAVLVAGFAALPAAADAHRSHCHRKHACPSDHATYRWRGQLCVKPDSRKRNKTFRKRVRYDGKTYYCKR